MLAQLLKSRMTKEKIKNPLEALQEAIIEQELGKSMLETNSELPVYAYGRETSIDDILEKIEQADAVENASPEFYEPKFTEPVTKTWTFKQGGSPLNIQSMYAAGGREDHRHGKHVEGPGDGQSDDIPAWLADGEFVFPADVVSALGNGSTKAGTLKLYQMMHNIRKRARSTDHKNLPPAALKSPLDYIKGQKS